MVRPLKIHGSLAMAGIGSAVDNLELEEISGDPQTPNVSQIWFNLAKIRVGYCEALNNKVPVVRYLAHLDDLTSINTSIANINKSLTAVTTGPAIVLAKYRAMLAQTTGVGVFPVGTAKPLITGGNEVWGLSVTPKMIGSIISARFTGNIDASKSASKVTIALFRDSIFLNSVTINCGVNTPIPFALSFFEQTTSATPARYSVRIGVGVSGVTWVLGGLYGSNMGGGNKAYCEITEEQT